MTSVEVVPSLTQPQRLFIKSVASGMSWSAAAEVAGVSRTTAYAWKNNDRQFAAELDQACHAAVDAVEDALFRSATEYLSDRAIQFVLKNRRPERWSDHASLSVETSAKVEQDQLANILAGLHRAADRLNLTAEQQANWPLFLAEELREIEAAQQAQSLSKET